MGNRRLALAVFAVLIIVINASALAGWWPFSDDDDTSEGEPATTIDWDDLIPDDFVQPENPFASMSQEEIDTLLDGSAESEARLQKLQEEFSYAPVVEELDGQRVRLAAYITPLEFDGQAKLNEFLLVPYLGACIHTPPPPANQVVHAQPSEAIELDNPYEPVWAIGTIRAETVKSDLAESGYRFEVDKLLPYAPE